MSPTLSCVPSEKEKGKKDEPLVVATAVLKLFANKSWSSGLASAPRRRQVVLRTLCLGKFFSLCRTILLR